MTEPIGLNGELGWSCMKALADLAAKADLSTNETTPILFACIGYHEQHYDKGMKVGYEAALRDARAMLGGTPKDSWYGTLNEMIETYKVKGSEK